MPKQPLLSAYRPVIGVTTKSEYYRAPTVHGPMSILNNTTINY